MHFKDTFTFTLTYILIMNDHVIPQLEFVFNQISNQPKINLQEHPLPDYYKQQAIGERLWLLRLMIQDLTDTYTHHLQVTYV